MELLTTFVVLLGLITMIGILNERLFHIPQDIALVLFSFLIGVILLVITQTGLLPLNLHLITDIDFENFLLEGVLCFMLFSGASKMHLSKFVHNLKPIVLLALLTTVLSSFLYGALFFAFASVLHLEIGFWTCVLLGCIVSPTDPIAATSILNKLGLSKNVTSIIEGESLFNDGTGVALFVFVKGIVSNTSKNNFLVLMSKEIFGALFTGFVISLITYSFLKLTKDPVKQILISLMNVAIVYIICEHAGFSGVIASVVCGMYYSYFMEKHRREREVYDHNHLYEEFWDVVDSILNSILFVLIGLSLLTIPFSKSTLLLIPVAIIFGLCARAAGVACSCLLVGTHQLPSQYSFREFVMLMTWSALRGGLSLALVLGTKEFLPENIYVILLNTTYITIFFTIIFQGLTTGKVYGWIEKSKLRRQRARRKE